MTGPTPEARDLELKARKLAAAGLPSIYVYSHGLLCVCVCAHDDATPEQILAAAEAQDPCGTTTGWHLADHGFADGSPQGSPCNSGPGRRHWLVVA